jgi:hypothetical protein
MNILAALHQGAEFTDPTQKRKTSRPIDGFVDDTTGCTNRFTMELLLFTTERHNPQKSYDLLVAMVDDAQKMAQRWERLLWSTGGKLELTKCFTYILHWVFDDTGKPTLATNDFLEKKLEIQPIKIQQSGTGEIDQLEQKECTEPHRTLGPIIAPDRKQKGESQRLTTKSRKHADDLRVARVAPKDANTYTHSIYLPSITYSAPITSFSKKELHKIQSPYTRIILNKQHFPRIFPSPMVSGPKEMGGVDYPHLYAKQGTAKTLTVMRN